LLAAMSLARLTSPASEIANERSVRAGWSLVVEGALAKLANAVAHRARDLVRQRLVVDGA